MSDTARQIGGTIVGATIGFVLGGPAGALKGALWGYTLGGAFRHSQRIMNTDRALTDLKVQVSSYGVMIPIIFGRMRTAGNMIWSRDKERHTITTVTRVGLPWNRDEVVDTTYWYSITCAVLVCQGPALAVRKIFANGKLIYDVSLNASPDGHIASHQVRVYLGDEDQEPSALMEAYLGAGNAPAYRGYVRVEFDTLALGPWGGNIPTFEFEVIRSGTEVILDPQDWFDLPDSESFYASYSGTNNYRAAQPTPNTERVWVVLSDGGNARKLGLVNAYSREFSFPPLTFDGDIAIAHVDNQGRAWISKDGGSDEGLRIVTQGGGVTVIEFELADGEPTRWNKLVRINDEQVYLLYNNTAAAQWDLRYVTLAAPAHVHTAINSGRWFHSFLTNAGAIVGRCYVACHTLNSTTAANARLGYAAQNVWTTLVDYNRDDIVPEGIVSDEGYIYCRSANTGEANRIEKRNASTGALIDYATLTGISATTYSGTPAFSLIDDDAYLIVQLGTRLAKIATGTMEEELTADVAASNEFLVGGSAYGGLGVVVTQIGSNNTILKLVPPEPLYDVLPPTLDDVVTELVEHSALTAADLNVTALAAIDVQGFALTQQGSIRDALELLRGAFFFDATESDYKLKFVLRDGASIVTIPQDDLGARSPGESAIDPLRTVRMQELELPRRVNVNYVDRDADYQIGKQSSKRTATESQQEVTIGLPVVLTAEQAAQVAEAAMYEAWTLRESHELATSRAYALYEPCDVITAVAGGVNHVLRLVEKHEGANGVIRWRAVTALAEAYTQVAPGAEAGGTQTVTMLAPSEPVFLDTHLLRDEDDLPGFYFGAHGLSDNWSGAKLYQSRDDGTSYEAVANGVIPSAVTAGVAETVLAATDADRVEFFDWANTVDVRLESGELSSYTRAQILEGAAPPYQLGGEIFYARSAVPAAGTYTLSGLLRARAGTESYMDAHAIGERFVVLDSTLRTIPQSAGDIGLEFDYKAVSIGSTVGRASNVEFTNTALRLKPLSPVQVRGKPQDDDDYVIRWRRRTRYDAPLRDGVDAPLGEASERYEIDILRDGAVVRTLEATENTVTYTAAQQTADFGAAVAELAVDVYQMSEAYGRGYPASETLNPLTEHRYWRINAITVPSGSYLHLSELALFRDGVDITADATTSASGHSMVLGPLSRMTDGNLGTNVAWNETDVEDGTFYLQFDFGAGTESAVNGIKQAGASTGETNRFMQAFTLQYSDDGSSWTTLGSKSGLSEPGAGTFSALYSF